MTKIKLRWEELKESDKLKLTTEEWEEIIAPIIYNEKFKCWFIPNTIWIGIKSADFDWADKSSPYHAYIELDNEREISATPFINVEKNDKSN